MASDRQVTSQIILQTVTQLQRQGTSRLMEELEKIEPDLAEWLMENLSLIHQKLLEVGATAKQTLRLQRQVESLTLVCIMALRRSHYELWKQMVAGTPVEELEKPADSPDEIADENAKPDTDAS